jgi:hypothetical protein
MSGYWRHRAERAINEAIAQFTIDNGVGDFSQLTPEQRSNLRQALDSSYTYGVRSGHPYRTWLDVRRQHYYRYGFARRQPDKLGRPTRKPPLKVDPVSPGQLRLFDY